MKTRKVLYSIATALLTVVFVLSGCTAGEYIDTASRTVTTLIKELEFTSSINNGEGKSTATFELSSTIEAGEKQFSYQPTAYLNVTLEKNSIDVESFAPLALAGEETISDNDYANGTTLGKDIVKKFVFSDGQVATVSYGWRYEKTIIQGIENEINTPYLEISPVVYSDNTPETLTDNARKVTLVFKATCTKREVSNNPETRTLELKPWYTQNKKAGDIVGEPIWSKDLVWKDNGYLTVTVTKTIPHSLADDEVFTYQKDLKVIMGEKINTKWYVSDTYNRYAQDTATEGTESFVDGVWFMAQTTTAYHYVPTYRTPGGEFTPDFTIKIQNWDITFNNGEKNFDFKVNVVINFSHKIVNEPTRAALYPGETYLGSDLAEFSYVDTVTGKEVYSSQSYTDFLLHP